MDWWFDGILGASVTFFLVKIGEKNKFLHHFSLFVCAGMIFGETSGLTDIDTNISRTCMQHIRHHIYSWLVSTFP